MTQTTLDKKELITIRDFDILDKNFILATWIRGLYYGDPWFNIIPKAIFMENMRNFLERKLNARGVSIKVACLKEDPSVILGYSVYRDFILDWIFVKSIWRNIDIATALLPPNFQACAHMTKAGLAIVRSKYPKVIYNPFV